MYRDQPLANLKCTAKAKNEKRTDNDLCRQQQQQRAQRANGIPEDPKARGRIAFCGERFYDHVQTAAENLERATGIEPATSSLGSWRSTIELRPLGEKEKGKSKKEKDKRFQRINRRRSEGYLPPRRMSTLGG